MDEMKMAANIRTLRRGRKETQAEAAFAIGITPASWAMYETGERIPRDDVKFKIANHFDTTVGSIFFGEILTSSENEEE